jgi:hypothetical protein
MIGGQLRAPRARSGTLLFQYSLANGADLPDSGVAQQCSEAIGVTIDKDVDRQDA